MKLFYDRKLGWFPYEQSRLYYPPSSLMVDMPSAIPSPWNNGFAFPINKGTTCVMSIYSQIYFVDSPSQDIGTYFANEWPFVRVFLFDGDINNPTIMLGNPPEEIPDYHPVEVIRFTSTEIESLFAPAINPKVVFSGYTWVLVAVNQNLISDVSKVYATLSGHYRITPPDRDIIGGLDEGAILLL